MAIIEYSDYSIPSFLEGSTRRQPVPFEIESPLTGAPFIKPKVDAIEDLPVAWDVSLMLNNDQVAEFKRFSDDLFSQPERQFNKAMVTEYGYNIETLTITSGRPQPVKVAFNLWAVSFSVYSVSLSRVQTPIDEPPVIDPIEDTNLVPSDWNLLTPKHLNSGAASTDPKAPYNVDFVAARFGNNYAIASYAWGFCARSIDAMRTWQPLPKYLNSGVNPATLSSNGAFYICMSSTGQKMFSCWLDGRSSISNDFGATWTVIPQGLGGLASSPSDAISAAAMSADGSRIVAQIGDQVGVSVDGGANWTMRNPGAFFGYFHKSIAMTDDGSKIVIGSVDAKASISTDGGMNWTALPDALGTTHTGNCNACAMSTDGRVIFISIGAGAAYSKDGGETWLFLPELVYTGSPTGEGDYITDCKMSSSGQKMLVITSNGYASYTEDAGSSWTMLTRGLDHDPNNEGLSCAATNGDVWISGGRNGQTSVSGFVPVFIPEVPPARAPTNWVNNPPRFLNSGAATSSGDSYTCMSKDGDKIFYGQTAGWASRTLDRGTTWTAMVRGLNCGAPDVSTVSILHMDCSEDGQKVVAVFTSGWASMSNDGGATWAALPRGVNTGSLDNLVAVCVSANGQTIIVGNSGGYASISYNGGTSFTALPRNLASGSGSFLLNCLTMSGDGQKIYSGFYQGYGSRSLDGGATWNALPLGLGVGTLGTTLTRACISKDGQIIYYGTSGGEVKFSVNGGASWTLATPNGLNSGVTGQLVQAIECSYDGTVAIVGMGTGYVSYTANSGTTWAGLPRGLNTTFNLAFTSFSTNSNVWFAAQNNGRAAISLPPA